MEEARGRCCALVTRWSRGLVHLCRIASSWSDPAAALPAATSSRGGGRWRSGEGARAPYRTWRLRLRVHAGAAWPGRPGTTASPGLSFFPLWRWPGCRARGFSASPCVVFRATYCTIRRLYCFIQRFAWHVLFHRTVSERLHKVLEYINEVHSLCGVLGIDFGKTVNEVHPSLHQNGIEQSRNISNSTLEGLASTISKLKAQRKSRIYKMRETMESLCQLWKLMDTPEEENRQFSRVMSILILQDEGITSPGVLSQEIIEKMEAEVEKLTKLRTSRLMELVMKKRTELEDICQNAHIEPDVSTAPDTTNALIDSGLLDPSELLANIESQILKAKEESLSRKEITDRINKWIAACDEEAWLEEYNQDPKRYSAGRGAHINLRKAEKARILVTKIPSMVENLINRTFAWENARNKPFLYDGGRLIYVLEEYRLNRAQKEEERQRYRLELLKTTRSWTASYLQKKKRFSALKQA